MTKRIKDAAKEWPPTVWGTNDEYAAGFEPDAAAIIVSAKKVRVYVYLTVVQNHYEFFANVLPLDPDDLDAMVTALNDAVGSELGEAGHFAI